jgi:hypothetical protein
MMAVSLPPGGTTELYALLKIVSDADATRARLDEITTATQVAQVRLDEALQAEQRLATDRAVFEQRTAAAAITAAEQQVGLERQREELKRREKILADFDEKVTNAQARVAALDEEIAVRSKTLENINIHLAALRERL